MSTTLSTAERERILERVGSSRLARIRSDRAPAAQGAGAEAASPAEARFAEFARAGVGGAFDPATARAR